MKKLCSVMALILLLSGCSGVEAPKELTQEDINTYSAAMSKDPLSGEFTLNGVKYVAPKIQELLDNGLKFTEKVETMDARTKTGSPLSMNNGGPNKENSLYIHMQNTLEKEIPAGEATFTELTLESYDGDQKNTLVLPKGITLKSTYNDVIKAYGEPKIDFLAEAHWIGYQSEDFSLTGRKLMLYFDDTNTTIKKIIIGVSKIYF